MLRSAIYRECAVGRLFQLPGLPSGTNHFKTNCASGSENQQLKRRLLFFGRGNLLHITGLIGQVRKLSPCNCGITQRAQQRIAGGRCIRLRFDRWRWQGRNDCCADRLDLNCARLSAYAASHQDELDRDCRHGRIRESQGSRSSAD